jgi:hypothetical protein
MSLFDLFAILITTTALLSYINARVLRLPPTTVGVLAVSLTLSWRGSARPPRSGEGLTIGRLAECVSRQGRSA